MSRGGERHHEVPLSWRRIALGTVLAVVVGGGVVLLIGRVAGFSKLSETLGEADARWLVVCALGQVVVFAGYAGAYRAAVAFEGGPRIGLGLSLRVVLAGFGLGQIVAAGGVAGLAVTYWALLRARFEPRAALVRLIGFDTYVYLVFGLIGFAAGVSALVAGAGPRALSLAWIVTVPVLLVLARWFTAPGRVEAWADDDRSWLRRALGVGVSAAWWVRRALAARDGRAAAPWIACYWVGDMASLWGGMRSVGVEAGAAGLLLAYATGYVAGALPLPFAATGGVDAATTFTLHAVGVPLDQALIGVVAHRIFAFWVPLVPGLALAALLPGTGRRLEEAAGGGQPAAP